MLKDITLGQYFPGDTLAHRLDPRTKLLATVLYIIAIFLAKGPIAYGVLILTLIVSVRISKVGARALFRGPRDRPSAAGTSARRAAARWARRPAPARDRSRRS